jgi:hypothetical protein
MMTLISGISIERGGGWRVEVRGFVLFYIKDACFSFFLKSIIVCCIFPSPPLLLVRFTIVKERVITSNIYSLTRNSISALFICNFTVNFQPKEQTLNSIA